VRTTFDFLGQPVSLEQFLPSQPGRHPIVMALHGSGGMAGGQESSQFAQLLADQGFCVFAPHYFEPSGIHWADDATIWREFPNWMWIISSAIDFAQQQPATDPNSIGLVGFSLGGYLALSLGVEQKRIKAVVDFFGGMPDHFAERLNGMPPVLILHGQQDRRVPVTEAHKIASLLDSRHLPYELKIYQNAGHGFGGLDMMDAGRRTFFFLKKHLG
jgi:carboxymethylenebutenolidase